MRNRLLTCFAILILFGTLCTVGVSSAPSIQAKGACLMEADSGSIVWEQNGNVRLPMASTTKIMTALVAIEKGELDKKVKVSDKAIGVEGSSIYLKSGEVLTLRQLLYAVLLESANDAATAVAIEIGGSIEEFAAIMNDRAKEMGLSDTHFTNPHGLDDEDHYTTAAELAKITAEALKNRVFREIVSTYKTSIPGRDYDRLLVNHNRLLVSYDGAIGVKTGFTKRCGRCLVSAAERDGVTVVAVTLSDPNDWQDHKEMLDYGFSKLKSVEICGDEGLSFMLPISGSDSEFIRACTKEKLRFTAESGAKITSRLVPRRFLWAPIKKGDYVGYVEYLADGEVMGMLELFATENCSAYKQNSFISNLFSSDN